MSSFQHSSDGDKRSCTSHMAHVMICDHSSSSYRTVDYCYDTIPYATNCFSRGPITHGLHSNQEVKSSDTRDS